MSVRFTLGLTAGLLLAAPAAASAGAPVPAALNSLKPTALVEYVIAQREVLALTDAQLTELGNLSVAIRTEPHRFVHQGGKPHTTRHVPMTSRKQAWEQAQAILAAEQRARLASAVQVPAQPKSRPAASRGGKR
jgi:hypothetical protein